MKLILASNSPRRRELLALTGWSFHVMSAGIDERTMPDELPDDYVKRIADRKADAAWFALGIDQEDDITLIACDTTVAVDGDILGKPIDATQASQMLRRLRGGNHQVYSALSVVTSRAKERLSDLCTTNVPMRNYSDEEMQVYIESGDPMDKAGAYAIQHADFTPVVGLTGCYANVMGLPLCHLSRTLHKIGISPERDVPGACQTALGYDCPVYSKVLEGLD
jgi:MAF protein